jgi:Na+/phosphate symporter
VLSVIGGWFLTAIIAFTASFLIANFLFYGGILAVIVMAIVAAVFIIRTQRIHKSRSIKQQQLEDDYYDQKLTEQQNALIRSNRVILSTLINSSRIYFDIIKAVSEDNRNHLRLVQKEIALLNNGISRSNGRLYGIIQQLEEKDLESGQSYIQSLDYVRELVRSLESIFDQSFHHINNNHKGFTEIQIEELNRLGRLLSDYHFEVTEMIKKHNYPEVDNLLKKNKELNLVIEDLRKNQIKRIKHEKDKTKRSMLFLSILFETKNILRDSESLLLVQEQFINRIDSNRELANYPLYQE